MSDRRCTCGETLSARTRGASGSDSPAGPAARLLAAEPQGAAQDTGTRPGASTGQPDGTAGPCRESDSMAQLELFEGHEL